MDISSFGSNIVMVCPDCGFETDEFLSHSAVSIELDSGRDGDEDANALYGKYINELMDLKRQQKSLIEKEKTIKERLFFYVKKRQIVKSKSGYIKYVPQKEKSKIDINCATKYIRDRYGEDAVGEFEKECKEIDIRRAYIGVWLGYYD
jgi:hypothetical protein